MADDLMASREAWEWVVVELPSWARPPTWESWQCWARPSFRRRHPDLDVPAPAGRTVFGSPVWRRRDLAEWVRRRTVVRPEEVP